MFTCDKALRQTTAGALRVQNSGSMPAGVQPSWVAGWVAGWVAARVAARDGTLADDPLALVERVKARQRTGGAHQRHDFCRANKAVGGPGAYDPARHEPGVLRRFLALTGKRPGCYDYFELALTTLSRRSLIARVRGVIRSSPDSLAQWGWHTIDYKKPGKGRAQPYIVPLHVIVAFMRARAGRAGHERTSVYVPVGAQAAAALAERAAPPRGRSRGLAGSVAPGDVMITMTSGRLERSGASARWRARGDPERTLHHSEALVWVTPGGKAARSKRARLRLGRQRYLCRLGAGGQPGTRSPSDSILRFIPLKADRALPGKLLQSMAACCWRTADVAALCAGRR
ncbi:unnamed protein product [Prorocentrum cordatum]|uniref:Uncharacterized protein n=1 Tax=Prorocentrum cordatum TaxID=2364126 RepID=A0ABN9S4V4_9DINO|nr:unnamed protein product [Polarella glacialis]